MLGTTHLFNALWQPFEQEFKSDVGEIQRCGKEVREEIKLAKARADFQDQELQKKERDAASGYRHKLSNMLSRTGDNVEAIKGWQLQRDKRRSGEFPILLRGLLFPVPSFIHTRDFQKIESASCSTRYPPTTTSLRLNVLAKSATPVQHCGYLKRMASIDGRTVRPSGSGARGKVSPIHLQVMP